MCEMTSMGEMSAAMMVIADGLEAPEEEGPVMADLRSAFTTSFTPRRRVLVLAAVGGCALVKKVTCSACADVFKFWGWLGEL